MRLIQLLHAEVFDGELVSHSDGLSCVERPVTPQGRNVHHVPGALVTLHRILHSRVLSEEAQGGLGAVEGKLGREEDPSLSFSRQGGRESDEPSHRTPWSSLRDHGSGQERQCPLPRGRTASLCRRPTRGGRRGQKLSAASAPSIAASAH
jgi:hypothetical protein